MSGYVLPQQLTPTTRAKATVLRCPESGSLMITVRAPATGTVGAEAGTAGSVSYELGFGNAGIQWEGVVRQALPGVLTRDLAFDAIRVWAMAPDAPQFVTVEADPAT